MAVTATNSAKLTAPTFAIPAVLWIGFWARGSASGNDAAVIDAQNGLFRIERTTAAIWRWSRPYSASTDGRARWGWKANGVSNSAWARFDFVHVGGLNTPILFVNGVALPHLVEVEAAGSLVLGSSALTLLNSASGVNPWDGTTVDGGIEALTIYDRPPTVEELQLIVAQGRYPLPGLQRFYRLATTATAGVDAASGQTATASGLSAASGSLAVPTRYWYVPANPYGSANGRNLVLRWSSVPGAAYYIVEQQSGSSWNAIAQATQTSHAIADLAANTAYSFRLRTVNSQGVASEPGNTFTVTTSDDDLLVIITAPPLPAGDVPLQLVIVNAQNRRIIADLTAETGKLDIECNEHGDEAVSLSARMPFAYAAGLLDSSLGHRLHINAPGETIWRGRLENPNVEDGPDGSYFVATAYGDQMALDDTPYTALLSDTEIDNWREMKNVRSVNNNRFLLKKNDGFTIALANGNVYTPSMRGEYVYKLPAGHQGNADAGRLSFLWYRNADANWQIEVRLYADANFLYDTSIGSIPNSAGNQGSATFNINGNWAWIGISFAYNGSANYTYPNSDGEWGLTIQSPRILTVPATTLAAGDIVTSLLTTARADGAALSPSLHRIGNPGYDRVNAVYFDESRMAILDELASLGDMQTPPRRWSWEVLPSGVLRFGPTPETPRYRARLGSWQIGRALEDIYNQVYAVYEDSKGDRAVTSVTSRRQIGGVNRRKAITKGVQSASEAAHVRDVAISDLADPLPRVTLELREVTTPNGAPVPGWRIRGGAFITLTDLTPTLGGRWDRLRTFRIVKTRFDAIKNTVSVTLESPQPAMEWLLARRAEGL